MKQLFIVILVSCFSYITFAQITGTGTYADPFTGTMTEGGKTISPSDPTNPCPNPCYFDQIVVSGGTLHIENTVDLTMYATSPTSSINIVGEGIIAAGNDNWGSMITFSASNATWGGILFSSNNSSVESYFYRCIIEKGYTSWNGGGIRINTSIGRIAIAYCEIRGNSAVNGGGIYIYGPQQSVYRNRIYNNTASGNGGGIYLEGTDNTSDIRTNIIHHNTAALGGGIFLPSGLGAARLCDLTVVSNTATAGADIYNDANSNAEFYNVIAWGSSNSVCDNKAPTYSNFYNCAMQGYTGPLDDNKFCFPLSSNNDDVNGPHFTNPAANNYLITFSSPCRDKGTHTWKYSYPLIPGADIRLKDRVGEYDIGVYEVQYSRWLGGANDNLWGTTANWEMGIYPESTSGTGDVIIPAGRTYYPTGSEVQGFTINSGNQMIIEPGAKATLNNLGNNGILNLQSTSSSGIFSLKINDIYSGSGTVNAELFLTGAGGPAYNWHYVAVPFTDGLSKDVFTAVNAYNLLTYDNSRVSTSDFEGWLWHNGQAHGGLAASNGFSTLLYGKGYDFYHNISGGAKITLSAVTPIGTTLPDVALQYGGSGDNEIRGFNLLGNSLTCSLDWDNVTFSGSVGHTVYFTSVNQWVSYLTGAGSANSASNLVPPLQGFFVKANATGASVSFPSNTKVNQATQARYKKSDSSEAETKEEKAKDEIIVYPKIKLELNGTSTSDETVVWFNDEATAGYNEKYDGDKLFSGADFGQLYSTLGGRNYVFNGISLPSDSAIVPLGIKIAQAGSYSLLKKVLEKLDNYDVWLIDKTNGNYIVDLKKSDKYTFSSNAGTFADRFILKFAALTTSAEVTTSTEVPKVNNSHFNIYNTEGFINILPPDDFISGSDGILRIYDLTGRIVKQANRIGLNGGTLFQLPFNEKQGIYIVEITSGLSRYKGKVFIR
jgi:parallel beta-helix repeat protein